MDREQVAALVRDSKLVRHADAILAELQDSVRLRREPAAVADIPLGASRFGGPPDLPQGMAWPTWRVRRRRGIFRRRVETVQSPLDFLAQIDLGELPDIVPPECPRQGMLYFFYDMQEQPWDVRPPQQDGAGAQVIHLERPGRTARVEPPPERARHMARPCRIVMESTVTLPESAEALFGNWDDYEEYLEDVAAPVNEDEVVHRMFGHPQSIQDEGEIWDPDQDLLLLQIDSDDARNASPGWMWGDLGRLYFTIRRDALARRAFDETRLTLQCH